MMTKKKTVSFYDQVGQDKGNFFLTGLNLKRLQRKGSTYDYYTRIIPIGQDGLTIESVNDGKNYLENYQYTNKVKTYIWKDESYTDAAAMKEDAEAKLKDLSKPEVSYSADIIDLAKQRAGYDEFFFFPGRYNTLIVPPPGSREKQRHSSLHNIHRTIPKMSANWPISFPHSKRPGRSSRPPRKLLTP